LHATTTLRSRLGANLAALCSLTAGLAAQTTTVTVPCAADNTLYEDALGSVSNGAGPGFFVGLSGVTQIQRALLRFDVAAVVPAGASIVAAQLSFEVEQASPQSPLNLDVTAHRALQAWGEGASIAFGGGGFGGPAQTGDATWLHTFYPSTFWTTPGGDFVAAPSFTIPTPQAGLAASTDGPETVVDVQFFLDNPALNFGWVLKSDESLPAPTSRRIKSRTPTSGAKPTLTVTYILSGQTGSWGTGTTTPNGTFTFAYIGAMTGGNTVQLSHVNGPSSSIGVNYWALDLYQPGVLLQPGSTLYLPFALPWIPGLLFLTDPAGAGSSFWQVPSIYPGLYFVTQSAALDNSPLGLALTNAGVAKIL